MAEMQEVSVDEQSVKKTSETPPEKSENLSAESPPLPEYTYPYNQESRNALMKDLNFSPEMMNAFNKLCVYAVQPNVNSAVINIDEFLVFFSGREDLKGLQKQTFLAPLFALIKLVIKEDLGIIEVTNSDGVGHPIEIVLKERQSELSQLYRYVADYFESSYKGFLEKSEILLSKEEALGSLSISEAQFGSLLQSVNTNELTFESLTSAAKSDRPLTLFSGNDFISNVIFPTNKISRLVNVFVRLINSYYEDNLNEEIRIHVTKKVREQKLDTRRLTRIIKEGIVGDAYFLFFSQLFYNIMLSVMEKISQQNFQNKEIYNQCFISFLLSRLSINERNLLVEKKRKEEAIDEHYRSIVLGLIGRSVMKRGSKVYVPFNISMLLELESETFTSEAGDKTVKLNTLYNEKGLYELIRKHTYTGQAIEDILVFSSSNVKYYCHRVRLIASFMEALAEERETVERTIHEDWIESVDKIVSKDKEEEFIELVEREYISSFFKNYLILIFKTLHASNTGGNNIDYAYLAKRLFFTEDDKLFISSDAQDLLYKSSDIEKKKYVLEKFCDVLVDTKTGQDKGLYEILDLSFPAIRQATVRASKMGWFKKTVFVVREFFSGMVLFFEGNKNYLSFLTRRYYKLPGRISKKQTTNKKTKNVLRSVQNTNFIGGMENKGADSGKSANRQAGANKVDKKAALKALVKNVPDLKDSSRIQRLIEEEHDLWNIKIGQARNELREMIDSKIETMINRFDPSAFVKENMDMFYKKIASSDKITGIGNEKSLKNYIFYKAAWLRYQRLK